MKILGSILCLFILSSSSVIGQVSNHFNFQGLLLDELGVELKNKELQIIIEITQDEQGDIVAYSESHFLKTNDSGVFDINIGAGEPIISSFDQIEWLSYVPYIQMEYQLSGSGKWKKMDASKFHSVPFSLYAQKIVCQEGVPGFGTVGTPGLDGRDGAAGPQAAGGPTGPDGNLGELRLTNIEPSDASGGTVYLDDGTNREDGKPGFRYYDRNSEAWVDL